MFEMDHPWWEFVVRGAAVYLILLVMVRVSGRRTVGQFTPFDLLVVMLLSEAVSNSLTGGDQSLIGGFIVAAVLVGLNMTMSFLSSHSKKMSDILDGSAVLLGRDGELYDKVMKRCRISREEVDQALRCSDCDIKDMRCAFLEADGQITIQKK
ncbi:DUF421 domain-containing protein [Massilia sp. DJPM01]|uniref:DUF421 domain-containing protein n=1 Tax=Massilia sp. DJPM01 TaxID=3024404 RepID=UPI00259F5053|nr:YetF domain-containing protein [Massilia sp. DJPM01]MDM5181024.1 DUF421 domain-containing protein [Massilia sp. DJPM01]